MHALVLSVFSGTWSASAALAASDLRNLINIRGQIVWLMAVPYHPDVWRGTCKTAHFLEDIPLSPGMREKG